MDIQKSSAALLARPGVEFAGLPQMNIPWVESPFFGQLLEESDFSEEDKALARHFAENGYAVVDPHIHDFDALASAVIDSLADKYQGQGRVQDAWTFNEHVKRLALAPRIDAILRILYQRDPIPFQTLNFPYGTQQGTHSDTVHFHCVPHRFMCGVWVALEDTDTANGPLHIYPGSQKHPVWNFHDMGLPSNPDHYELYEAGLGHYVETAGLQKMQVHLKKGQALIWAANVLHGGDPILDQKRSRHSQVTHFFFSDCLYYTPMLSDPYIGRMFLRSITDIRSGKPVPNMYNGQVITRVPPDAPTPVPPPQTPMQAAPVQTMVQSDEALPTATEPRRRTIKDIVKRVLRKLAA
ncbi:MAG: phytanoyl-CoA dioxygenase family protein [Candidatus Peregrinibacteria bacterium]|nr:phytanoyl-CoA dioxygenase family protein [Candidatus Peregrinibacteria bacterium]